MLTITFKHANVPVRGLLFWQWESKSERRERQ